MSPIFWPVGTGGKGVRGLTTIKAETFPETPLPLEVCEPGPPNLHGLLGRIPGGGAGCRV